LVVIVAIIIETSGGVMPIIVVIVFMTVLLEVLFGAMPSSTILWELPRWLEKGLAIMVIAPMLYIIVWNIGEVLKDLKGMRR
jgi:Na+/H+ antiporter NhaC